MFSARLAATATAFFTLVSASPALQARSCTPNFDSEGAAVTIFRKENGSLFQWQPRNEVGGDITAILTPTDAAFAASEFLIKTSGYNDNSFRIEFVDIYIFPVGMDAKSKPFSK